MMKELYNEKKKSFVNRAAEAGLIFVIGLYILLRDITKTTLDFDFAKGKDKYIIMVLAVLVVIRLADILIEDKENRKRLAPFLIAALAVDAAFFRIWLTYPEDALVIFALANLGLIGVEYSKVIKTYIAAASMAVFPAIVMAWIGAVDNFVYLRGMTIRSSWGIKYPTDMMSLLLFLMLAAWVAYGRKGGFWFLIPGAVFSLMAYFVADSRTGALCGVFFMSAVCVEYWLSHSEPNVLTKGLKICACGIFPFFTVVMNGLVLAYRQGNPIAVKLSRLMSDRLVQSVAAIDQYGIGLWGKPLKMVGMGGSVFSKPDYLFVDISYVLLLIRYGIIALIIINVIWVLMTRKAFRLGDTRLALALALVAVNCVTEHHIMQLNYNIFIIIAFAVLSACSTDESSSLREGKHFKPQENRFTAAVEKVACFAVTAAAASALVISLLPKARTVISLTKIDDKEAGRLALFALIIVGLVVFVGALYCLYRLLLGLITGDSSDRKKCVAVISAMIIMLCLGIAASSMLIDRRAEKRAALIESERDVIELVQANMDGKLYVYDLPELYRREYEDISNSLFNGEELTRYADTSVIMNKNLDSPCFFNTGFLYTDISDKHALFTNDETVIRALQNEGYHLTGFFPLEKTLDLKAGDEKSPKVDLRSGRYTFDFDLEIDTEKPVDPDEDACRLQLTYYKGKYTVEDTVLKHGAFDENGHYRGQIVCELPDAEKTQLKVTPIGDIDISIEEMSYRKTPEVDVHAFYDKKQRISEEYYDLDGNPYYGSWGYAAKSMEYDKNSNIVREVYYDQDGQRTLNDSGCSEVRRTYDGNNRDIRDDYYGVEGERTALYDGRGISMFNYDAYGRMTEIIYYDINEEPVLINSEPVGGYHKVVRTFDDHGRLYTESFIGPDGELIMTTAGYASRQSLYDDNSNFIGYDYYDVDGNKVEL